MKRTGLFLLYLSVTQCRYLCTQSFAYWPFRSTCIILFHHCCLVKGYLCLCISLRSYHYPYLHFSFMPHYYLLPYPYFSLYYSSFLLTTNYFYFHFFSVFLRPTPLGRRHLRFPERCPYVVRVLGDINALASPIRFILRIVVKINLSFLTICLNICSALLFQFSLSLYIKSTLPKPLPHPLDGRGPSPSFGWGGTTSDVFFVYFLIHSFK